MQVGGALAFLTRAELRVTVVRTEMPLYKLRYDGIELEPGGIDHLPPLDPDLTGKEAARPVTVQRKGAPPTLPFCRFP